MHASCGAHQTEHMFALMGKVVSYAPVHCIAALCSVVCPSVLELFTSVRVKSSGGSLLIVFGCSLERR